MLLAVPEKRQLQEKFTKKYQTNFLINGDFFFKWLVYMFGKVKGLKISKTILQKRFGAWEFFINGGKKCIQSAITM